MHVTVKGRVLEQRKHVFGAWVRLFSHDPTQKGTLNASCQITNREGQFAFRLDLAQQDQKPHCQNIFFLQAYDESEKPMSDVCKVIVSGDGQHLDEFTLEVKPGNEWQLPTQPTGERLIAREIQETVKMAIQASFGSGEVQSAQVMAESFFCGLPPIGDFDDLLDVARGVLEGRADDYHAFQTYLDQMQAWNFQAYGGPRRALTDKEANHLLSSEFLGSLQERIKEMPRIGMQNQLVGLEASLVLMTAAVRVAYNQPQRMHGNLGIILEQFCGMNPLSQLSQLAQQTFLGTPSALNNFRLGLRTFARSCFPPGGPGGELPFPQPSPLPCGPPFWPPNPRDPGLPGHPGDPEGCSPELIRGVIEAEARGSNYQITGVSPEHACPGDELTITGTGLEVEGNPTVVLFTGFPRGTQIPMEAHETSQTEVKVIVPNGTVCGPLSLRAAGPGSTIFACGGQLNLLNGPSIPFDFEGGETRINYFASTLEGSCLRAGDTVGFRWDVCNVSEMRLQIATPERDVLFDEEVGGTGASFTVPAHDSDTLARANLSVIGPCGTDRASINFSIRRGTPLTIAELVPIRSFTFTNWHNRFAPGRGRRKGRVRPRTLERLVNTIRTAEQLDLRIGIQGTAWSYTNCIVPSPTTQVFVNGDLLGQNLDGTGLETSFTHVLPEALRRGIRSRLSSDVRERMAAILPDGTDPTPTSERLVHIRAGMKIFDLNILLDLSTPRLAMPTLGGDKGQSIAGAINTSTHGANPDLPPIADFVRAIHMVSNGGQEWWIEPEFDPITDPDQMARLKQNGALSPCINVVYDDTAFSAALVAMGCAGHVFSYVIEAVDAHNLSTTTERISWVEGQERIQALLFDEDTQKPWFLEAIVSPSGQTLFTTRFLSAGRERACPPPTPAAGPGLSPEYIAFLSFLFGPAAVAAVPVVIGLGTGALAGVMGTVGFYVARRSADYALYLHTGQFHRLAELADEIELIERSVALIEELVNALGNGFRPRDIAEFLPKLINVLWQIGFYVADGRTLVDTIQDMIARYSVRPIVTNQIDKSYVAMTGQPDRACSAAPRIRHSPIERLIESHEYAVPAEDTVDFVNQILDVARPIRASNDALVVSLNVRFTQRSRSLIGIQRFPFTGHVEVYTTRGLAGNDAFHRGLRDLAADFGAIPHWGQFHDVSRNFDDLYDWRLDRWREEMDRFARAGGDKPNTFRHRFAIERGLLREL